MDQSKFQSRRAIDDGDTQRQEGCGVPAGGGSAQPRDPGVVFEVHHLGVAVADMDSAIRSYRESLGLVVVGGPADDPIQRVRVCFMASSPASEVSIELICPLGDASPIDQYLKRGVGAYHVCYRVTDISLALEHLRKAGCVLVSGPVPASAFGGRRIAWLLLPSHQLVELVELVELDERVGS